LQLIDIELESLNVSEWALWTVLFSSDSFQKYM